MVMAYELLEENIQPHEGRDVMTKTEFKRNLPYVKALFSDEKDALKNILREVLQEVLEREMTYSLGDRPRTR